MNFKKGSIVVFGATGTLGTYLIDELTGAGYDVFACARRNIENSYDKTKKVRCASVDIVTKSGFEKLPQTNVCAVIQIAGAMPSRMVGYKPQTYIDVNITGTLNVLDYCIAASAGRFIYMQSHSDVAIHWNSQKPISANSTRGINYKGDHAVYIITKNAAVDLTEHYHQEFGLRTVILRLPTIYCYTPINEMYVNGEKRPIAYLYMIQRAIEGKPLEIWGDPNIVKDMPYVKDYTQIVRGAVESDNAQGLYNVGTGIGTSLEQQVRGIIEIFSTKSKPSTVSYCPEKPSQTGFVYDISKTCVDLGYNPQFSYLDMLKDMKGELNTRRFPELQTADLAI
ncbi:MAG: NAD(P)-dependent oxidoreductase [bacterium]